MPLFGNLAGALGAGTKKAGSRFIRGGAGINTGPTQGFMGRMGTQMPGMLNSMAQNYGGSNATAPMLRSSQTRRKQIQPQPNYEPMRPDFSNMGMSRQFDVSMFGGPGMNTGIAGGMRNPMMGGEMNSPMMGNLWNKYRSLM
jgi:hypothetical protein